MVTATTWYIINSDIHKDLNVSMVRDESENWRANQVL